VLLSEDAPVAGALRGGAGAERLRDVVLLVRVFFLGSVLDRLGLAVVAVFKCLSYAS
jgi:hypothetical protein